ncbi:hypothetical protein [Lysobacter sp. CA199]|uniref:hypothetical protein n=1 Tax=Lysobacter sp. CA199 TaxID=3455608 RepID=UPI003F8D1308
MAPLVQSIAIRASTARVGGRWRAMAGEKNQDKKAEKNDAFLIDRRPMRQALQRFEPNGLHRGHPIA